MDEYVLINNYKMFLDPLDSLELKSKGKFEKFETDLMKKEVKKGDIVFDIGANIGYYTLLFSKLVGNGGRVFAFEPDPNNFMLLQKNVQVNNLENVTLIPKAVSKKSGTIQLYLCDYNHAQHRIYESPRCNSSISIDCITIDDYVKSISSLNAVNLIKMDVEGSELDVVEGMTETLKKNPELKILSEFSPKQIREHGLKPEDLLIQFLNYDYKIYPITSEGERIISIDYTKSIPEEIMKIGHGLNLFLKKND